MRARPESTGDPGAAEAEYGPQGWKAIDIYTKAGYADLCDGHNWAVRFFRTAKPRQPELL